MKKQPITISVNPSYLCNFRCEFCYLTDSQLQDKNKVSLSDLETKLLEIQNYFHIDNIDLYGGEILMLPQNYLSLLIDLLYRFTPKLNLITNLSITKPILQDSRLYITVSWDSFAREKNELVYGHMKKLNRPFSLLMLASPKLLELDIDQVGLIINELNEIENLESVEIKPYSTNQANHFEIKYVDFEEFIKKWFHFDKKFKFINDDLLQSAIWGNLNSFSDDHIYLTPNAKYAVLDFDEYGNEYFEELNSIEEYNVWRNKEKLVRGQNSYCLKCEYFGRCLSEHLKKVIDVKESCNGFYQLIKWYERKNEKL